ncbi:transposase (plasmid) [Clostridium perfringens]|uniref:transposase n=1 Tax=Clostridium perfringens TaxID=1502 RepID=UPI000B3A4924|nr:transposase [Clostridium perfringens]EGT0694231.1 IS200/IS605 family transposase [Clostridium perfringens]EGT0697123.1 IS200/IS605 family transposase [Clostridium perfringens]MDU3376282.1 transposase [Clostridium perfringens]MDU3536362.1 transposase [Clostridium perfringens]OUN51875.1 hypothetical protein B5G18_11530 [Clostridium perfringens]
MDWDTNNRSNFKLRYKLTLPLNSKFSRIQEKDFNEFLTKVFLNIANKNGITLEEMLIKEYEIEILFRAMPNTNISKFINSFKSTSSRLIKKDFEFNESSFWKKTYCLVTKAVE